jgi:ubiquinol-cytochrome c reductase cytochrome b subunit
MAKSVLPFPSILDDIKEKGFRKAVYEGVDDIVERVTAGMNVQDIREALRGEAPSRRPNPRLQPHADTFWLHMRPSYFHQDMTGLYPTFRLGWLSTYFVVFETITGLFLMIWYTPSPEIAYGNMIDIMSNVPLGKLMRDMHRLGAEAMVIIVFLHMLRTFFTGSYKKPRQFTWFTGVVLLLVTLVLSFSGYLLPWDQLALWAVTIGASMVEAAPPQDLVGANLNLLVRGGPDMGANGLLRFYLLHVLVLPLLLFIFTGVHYYKVIIHGHSLPPQKENIGEDTAKRVPLDKRVYFIPDVLSNEMMWIGVTTFVLVVLSTWFFKAPLESHADPQHTPLHTLAPWYFLWIQGALKLGSKVFWGLVFPGLIFGFLAVMPYLDATPSRRYADRRVAMTVCYILLAALVIFSYWGLPTVGVETSGDIEVLAEMIPEEHAGVMRPIPFDQLVPGAYTTGQLHGDNPALAVEEFSEAILATYDVETFDDDGNAITVTTSDSQELSAILAASSQGTAPSQTVNFVPVPSTAPELLHAVEELEHLMEEFHLENGWGAIIITPSQDNVMRADVVIFWDAVGEDGEEIIRSKNIGFAYLHQDSEWFER